jgi:hypothetical protein
MDKLMDSAAEKPYRWLVKQFTRKEVNLKGNLHCDFHPAVLVKN